MPKPIVVLIVKWLVVPAIVGALGYAFVGPQVPRLLGVRPKKIEADALVSEESVSYAEPEVQIRAERVRSGTRGRDSEPPQTRRRRQRRAEPKPPPPVQEDPVIDEPPVVPPPPPDDDPPTGNDDPPNDEG